MVRLGSVSTVMALLLLMTVVAVAPTPMRVMVLTMGALLAGFFVGRQA